MTLITHVQDLNRSILATCRCQVCCAELSRRLATWSEPNYAGLGVIGADGGMQQFIHAGMNAATVASIGVPEWPWRARAQHDRRRTPPPRHWSPLVLPSYRTHRPLRQRVMLWLM